MKLKQLEYALCVSKTLSFSKAATQLYVSQPTISSTLQALEEELGYLLFIRNNQGISITPEGKKFLSYAKKIMEDIDNIKDIKTDISAVKFNVQSQFHHTLVDEAFFTLCKKYEISQKIEMSLTNGTLTEIIDNVFIGECDVGLVFMSDNILSNLKAELYAKGISVNVIKKLNVNVNVRKGHPLANIYPFPFDRLKEYTFTNYVFNKYTDIPELLAMGIVNTNKTVNFSNKALRVRYVANTDAFSIGASFHPAMLNSEYIFSIAIPNLFVNLIVLEKNNFTQKEEKTSFLNYLNNEVEKLYARDS